MVSANDTCSRTGDGGGIEAKILPSASFDSALSYLYGLLTLLVVEQDHTITAQKTLISQLYGDSLELTAMKGKEIQRRRVEGQAQGQAQGQMHAKARTQHASPIFPAKTPGEDRSGLKQSRAEIFAEPKGVEDNRGCAGFRQKLIRLSGSVQIF